MKLKNMIFSFLILLLMALLLIYPKQMLAAASHGLQLWYCSVLPSLFPFMVGVSLLLNMGAAELIGHFFEPIMRPLFRVSGACSFPFVMGFLSGYPLGAKITADLEQNGTITPIEAQRTLSFCNNPGPLFVVGTAATALLHCPAAGYFMMIAVFLGSLTTGLCFRFYGREKSKKISPSVRHASKIQYNTPMGALFGKSVFSSIETVVQIGGFIIVFSVLIKALELSNFLELLTDKIVLFLPNLSPQLVKGFLAGLLEMTNGSGIISTADSILFFKILFITAVLSFGGISILAQTLSILSATSVHTGIYTISKLCNSIFSSIYIIILYPFFQKTLQKAAPAFSITADTAFHKEIYFLLCFLFFLLCFFFLLQLAVTKCRK